MEESKKLNLRLKAIDETLSRVLPTVKKRHYGVPGPENKPLREAMNKDFRDLIQRRRTVVEKLSALNFKNKPEFLRPKKSANKSRRV